jgi:TPR repeat protein
VSTGSTDRQAANKLPPFPYPGLRPFESHEWRIFFGRESMINEVIGLMAGRNLVFIHGSSGSGKSSLVRAGVLPRLSQLHRLHGTPWISCAMRPSGGPLWNLAAEFAALEGRDGDIMRIGEIIRLFNRRDATLSQVVGELPALAGKQLCILVDQFEEVFRFERETSREEAELFIDLLIREIPAEAVEDADPDDHAAAAPERAAGNVHIIVTMRSEFLGDCARFDRFAEAINRAQYLVPRLTQAALIRAIRMPARLYGGEVELALAERLSAEVRGKPDELPLIQHGLMFFWDEALQDRPGEKIILDETLLEQAGSLRDLLSIHADRVMAAVAPDPAGQAIVQRLFRAITDINGEGQAIRRPLPFRDLVEVCGAPAAELRAIIDAFRAEGASFLTPYAPTPIRDDTEIDISHEALIRCWAALAGWIKAEAAGGEKYRELRLRAQLGQALLSGDELSAALAWRDDQAPSAAWARRYGGKADGGFAPTMGYLAASEQRAQKQLALRRRIARAKAIVSTIGIAAFATGAVAVLVWFAYGIGYADGRGDRDFRAGPREYARALIWYQRADVFGDGHAEDRIAAIYEAGGDELPANDKVAFNWYLKAAKAGVVDAELAAGEHYANGESTTQDFASAMTWFRAAAAGGSADANDQIGLLYRNAEGVPQSYGDAMVYFTKAADGGSKDAARQIALLYLNGDGVTPDDFAAVNWVEKANQENRSAAEFDIGMFFVNGTGVTQDYHRALTWFQRASADGSADAEDKIGLMYELGDGVKQNYGQASTWLHKAVVDGSAEAEYDLAFLYLNGQGVSKDDGQAMALFRKAADDGASDTADAENQVGAMYYNGEGVPVDYGRAFVWDAKAAAAGSADAQDSVGELYVSGQGVKQSYPQAIGWFEKAIANGSSEAEYHLGRRYLLGQGVAQDDAKAIKLFLAAAAQNCGDAEDQLGMLYTNGGQGVKVDYGQAMSWFQKGAANGSADAEYHIGFRYYDGDGVTQSYTQAMTWFAKAAADGSADGEFEVGYLYYTGEGVKTDNAQALSWFQKAVQDGADDADQAAEDIGLIYLNGQGVPANRTAAAQAFAQALTLRQADLASDPGDADTMGALAWALILDRQPQQALLVANQSVAAAPGQLWLRGNQADALMLLGQTDAARAIYVKYLKVNDAGNGASWKADVSGDFATIEKLYGVNPLMTEIRKDIGT